MATRVRDDFKSQEPDNLRSASRKASGALRSAASNIRETARDVAGAVQSGASSIREALPSLRTGASVTDDTDLLSTHTRSLQDKYDSFDTRDVNIALPYTSGRPEAVAAALAAAADLAPSLVSERTRPIIGEVYAAPDAAADAHHVDTAYYTRTAAHPAQSRYDLTRASGGLPRLYSDIQGHNAPVPGAHTTLFTAPRGSQREIDRARASGHVPALASFYRAHHNAVPLTSSLGPGSVQLQVIGPDGPIQLPAAAPLPARDRAGLSRAMAIERTRHSADLDCPPRAADYVRSIATGAADSILAGLHREEAARMRVLEEQSAALVKARREEVARVRAGVRRDLDALTRGERAREEAWQRELAQTQQRVRDAEQVQARLRAQQQQAKASQVAGLARRAAEVEKELAAARAEAARAVSAHEAALQLPRVAVDASGLEKTVAERRQHLEAQLAQVQRDEEALDAAVADATTRLQRERAAFTQAQREAMEQLGRQREQLQSAAAARLSQLQAAVERAEQESNARGQGHRARVAELRAAAADQEARLRGLAADSEASAREREATRLRAERELSSLFARRDAALRRAHGAQQQAAGARAQATSEARARAAALVREAEDGLVRARRELEIALSRRPAQPAIPASELSLCVEASESVAVPRHFTRERLHSAVGVEEHTHNVRVAVPAVERETLHLHLGPHADPVAPAPEQPAQRRGFFGGLFGRPAEARA